MPIHVTYYRERDGNVSHFRAPLEAVSTDRSVLVLGYAGTIPALCTRGVERYAGDRAAVNVPRPIWVQFELKLAAWIV